ncbi:MAG: DUF177 domain-containing protein [Paludibacteraceae bacterium]|nr:DUF177 domain-containing protein [Paludibacteraceae bacterium]
MASNDEHIINLDKLEIGRYSYDFVLDDAYLTAQERTELLGGKVEAHVALNLRANDFDLTVAVRGQVQLPCDRCLDPMNVDIDAEEDMAPLLDEEVEVIDNRDAGRSLDLNWLAYELIVVNLPLVHCHPEGGCNPSMDSLLQDHLCSTTEEPDTQDN